MQPPERLHKHATLELAHHVLKASMFKNISKQSGKLVRSHTYCVSEELLTLH